MNTFSAFIYMYYYQFSQISRIHNFVTLLTLNGRIWESKKLKNLFEFTQINRAWSIGFLRLFLPVHSSPSLQYSEFHTLLASLTIIVIVTKETIPNHPFSFNCITWLYIFLFIDHSKKLPSNYFHIPISSFLFKFYGRQSLDNMLSATKRLVTLWSQHNRPIWI